MRQGPFAGGSCSGLTYASDNNAWQVFVVNRIGGTFEIYEWWTEGREWVTVEEVAPIDGDRINEASELERVDIIQHPNPSWVPEDPGEE
jgi:hypothetical protein